ncbi:hypothetical protein VM1G_06514 [Cytospora mali]|uniref:PX domain-containing protein n=1 Tax=Cytospora mali TaxID=578113 RepID=A0A194W287_CYTMA|nr:hypothetical protein VM1G_06514 [Valsa mali]
MASGTPSTLSSTQLHALLDILSHNETYREAESFKYPQAIREYGYPFNYDETKREPPSYKPESSSPLLQLLLTRCILTVPGVGDFPPDFWPSKFQGIMTGLADADLSESYDKGTLGTRKTLAALASVVHESITRGLLGGVAKGQGKIDLQKATYDTTQASELARAWDECVNELVNGDLADEIFDHFAKTDDFEAHSPAIKAAVDYAILHLAALLHHILVFSSEGQYLVKLIQNVHNLVPYSMVRQTLRIGNAATMLSGMMRLFLAKMSVGAVTNFLGWTKDADDGMNLMQRIISLVLSWDATDFRKQAERVESSKDKPGKEHLAAIREHIAKPREAHEEARKASLAGQKSIIAVILDASNPKLTASLTESQHAQCLEWYSAQLSVRDREELIRVFCKSQPDYMTDVMRDAVATYEPYIRSIHGSLDLRPHVTSLETFLNDLLETSKPKQVTNASTGATAGKWKRFGGASSKGSSSSSSNGNNVEIRPPSVEDFVALLRRNRHLLFKYLHVFATSCFDVRDKFRSWAKESVKNFRNASETKLDKTKPRPGAAGAMSDTLQSMFSQLPPETQQSVLASLNSHATYLSNLESLSLQRMQRVLDAMKNDESKKSNGKPDINSNSNSVNNSKMNTPRTSGDGVAMSGPGVYLMRWETLLDDTLITPAAPSGPVRKGKDVKGQKSWGKTGSGGTKDGWDAGAIAKEEERAVPEAPDVSAVMDALGEKFREAVNVAVGDVGSSPPAVPVPGSTSE